MDESENPKRPPTPPSIDFGFYPLVSKNSTISDDGNDNNSAQPGQSDRGPKPDFDPMTESSVGFAHVARYEFERLLGRGAVGHVFAVNDSILERDVAMKILRADWQHDNRQVEKFVNEARIMAGLEHPNILPVYDLDRTPNGISYFTMRRAQGMTLAEAIRRLATNDNPPQDIVSLNGRMNIFQKVLDAVAFAHYKGVLHHDIKPDNIMLGQFGEVLVLDWGTAVDRNRSKPRENVLFGTPVYMSPEQSRREPMDERSDVYALGATLFQLLTLRLVILTQEEKLFWQRKRKGEFDTFDEKEQSAIPEALREIVLRALAPDKIDRWQTVQAFRDALHNFQSHAESLALAANAHATLEHAIVQQDYEQFVRSRLAFEQALTLWAECPQAREGLSENRLRHCECALNKGDLTLTESLIAKNDPRYNQVTLRLDQARDAEVRQRRRTRYILSAASLLVLIILSMCGYFIVDSSRYYGKWQMVLDRDFTKPDATLEGLSFTPGAGDWIHDYIPPKTGPNGISLKARDLIWYKMPAHAIDIQVEVSIQWPDTVDGFDIYMDVAREDTKQTWLNPAGYMCQVGGFRQDLCFQSSNNHPYPIVPIRVSKVAMKPGKVYRIIFQKIGEELSFWVDGTQIQQRLELLPLYGKEFNWIALRGWSSTDVLRLTVNRRAIPEKTTPLVAGDALITHGELEKAIVQYREIAADFPGSSIGELALAKACMSANALPGVQPLRESILSEFERQYPKSNYRTTLNETACVGLWRDEKYKEACERLSKVLKEEPDSSVILQILDSEHQILPDDVQPQFLECVAKSRVPQVDLRRFGLKSIQAISSAKFTRLILRNNLLTDITPLAGMPLTSLDVSENQLTDLEPLKNMPLTELACGDNNISSLSPLIGIPLGRLSCESTKIKKLIPCLSLSYLNCSYTPIENLEPLKGANLKTLFISGTRITDLEPLRGMPLSSIDFSYTNIDQIGALQGMHLSEIHADNTRLSSLDVLRGMPLEYISISDCKTLKSLQTLQGTPLHTMFCSGSAIANLEPLSKCTSLRHLEIQKCKISSLEPLRGLSISVLSIENCPVTSLEPLKGMPLINLTCSECPITSLEPLDQSPLVSLRCVNTQLQSVKPFEQKPPATFLFEGPGFTHDQLESVFSHWEKIPGQKLNVVKNRVARMVRDNSFQDLRGQAIEFDGHHYLPIENSVNYERATNIAKAAGGHLITIPTQHVNELFDRLGAAIVVWIGLVPGEDGKLKWVNGMPLTYTKIENLANRNARGPWALSTAGNGWMPFFKSSSAQLIIEWDN